MGNTVIISHGAAAPTISNLANYELGWSTNNQVLYINDNGVIRTVGHLPIASSSVLGGVKIGSGLEIAVDGTLSNGGVRSISTGTVNGTISVNTNGTTTNVSVYGLGSAAYTDSTAYASSSHSHGAADITSGTLAIAHGGTGATTASGALSALGGLALTGGTMTGNLIVSNSGTTTRYIKASNSNGAVALEASVNRGVWDDTASAWMIYTNQATTNTYVPMWASKGSSSVPVYFNASGEPTACSDVAEKPTIIRTNTTKSTGTSWTYSGLSITIPANKSFTFTVQAEWTTGSINPAAVGLSESSTSSSNMRMDAVKMSNSPRAVCVYTGVTGSSAVTYYAWGKASSSGNLYYSFDGFYF